MLRLKFLFAVLVVAVIAGLATQASAQVNVKTIIIGASGSWQAMGVAGYRAGACPTGAGQCKHWTDKTWTVTDSRPVSLGGAASTDTGTAWVLWDHNSGGCTVSVPCNLWVYVKVDSIVGNRCFFAKPRCVVDAVSFNVANANQITLAGAAWGADTLPPAPIQTLLGGGNTVQVAASEVRPEDALLGQCRINSAVGPGGDGLNGLGLTGVGGTPNPTGTCPSFGASLADLQGKDLVSGIPTKTGTAHPNAFNISGTDPFTNTAIPAFSTVQVGAVPLVFIVNRGAGAGPLANVKDVSLSQLQDAFSGGNCNGPALGGAAGAINVFSREPLSGTMNTAEYTAFRFPRGSGGGFAGLSQETGLTGLATVSDEPCTVGGSRWQGIGQGDLNFGLSNSNSSAAEHNRDGIGYTFFSYGNVSGFADNSTFRYLTINGADPIWDVYASTYDPGENGNAGQLPGQADLTLCALKFPCSEKKIWKGGLSYPNLRNGTYRQWAMIRLIGDTGSVPFNNAKALSTFAQASVVTTVPDFVPFAAVTGAVTDPGLKLLRSHYNQAGVVAPNNQTDIGGEEGGCIQALGSVALHLVQREFGCAVGP